MQIDQVFNVILTEKAFCNVGVEKMTVQSPGISNGWKAKGMQAEREY